MASLIKLELHVIVTGYLAGVEVPEFGAIRKIIYLPNHKCYFQIRKQVTILFYSHFHAFEVAESQDVADVIVTNAEKSTKCYFVLAKLKNYMQILCK